MLLMVAAGMMGLGQSSTTTCRPVGSQTVCDTVGRPAQDLGAYSRALGVPATLDYNQQESLRQQTNLLRQQAEALRIQNEAAVRRQAIQMAPGFDAKRCRAEAVAALNRGDLHTARQILDACVAP